MNDMARAQVMVWMLVATAACTVPNSRLCKNIPDCGLEHDQGTEQDLAHKPGDQGAMSMPDAVMPDAAMPDSAGQCNTDTHCGPSCVTCTGQTPYCSLDGSHCVGCRAMQDCQAGNYCTAGGACTQCNVADHCGPSCSVCTGSAQPTCSGTTLKCICGGPSDCGGTNPMCTSGVCTQSCNGLTNCANAAAGHACSNMVSGQCGCSTSADCGTGSTCIGAICMCGGVNGTVCKSGQTCQAGVCM